MRSALIYIYNSPISCKSRIVFSRSALSLLGNKSTDFAKNCKHISEMRYGDRDVINPNFPDILFCGRGGIYISIIIEIQMPR